MRQSVLMVEQRRPVKCFLTEFSGKFWSELGEGVDDPDDNIDAARRRAGQKKKKITEGRSMTCVIAEVWRCGLIAEGTGVHVLVLRNPKKADLSSRDRDMGADLCS